MSRVAVIGSTGQLGTDLVHALEESGRYEIVPLGHDRIECTDAGSVRRALRDAHPHVVVNCAAYVRVDDAEDHPEEALRVNGLGALHVARACAELESLCLYISTDFVFDGGNPQSYQEEDAPGPINVYGTSKLAGEYLVRQSCPRWMIARLSSLYGKTGARGKGGNFIEAILARARQGGPLRVIDDLRMSPSYSGDAARALEALIRQEATGIFHLANLGSCSWFEFAKKAVDLAGLTVEMTPVPASEYPGKAPRPRNTALRSTRPETRGLLRPWEEGLRDYMREKSHLR